MKKNLLFVFAMLVPFSALAESHHYEFGLSDTVSNPKRETVTGWLLDQQRSAPIKNSSELPASLYVDSQRRISDTFKTGIPENFKDKSNSTDSN